MDDDPPTRFDIQAEVSEDKRSVSLEIVVDGRTQWASVTDAENVERAIKILGEYRARMLEPVSANLAKGVHNISDYDPRWYICPDSQNRFVTFWIRNPGLGWAGYGFSRQEASSIAQWLRKIPKITTVEEKIASLSTSATSIGGDTFLITTEGLGFYYYGNNEKRISPDPFEQIEFDSDRSAGVVAGSIVDIRLEEALRSCMREDRNKAIAERLFMASGPIGSFSVKIDLAFMMGILSDDAYHDAVILKGIRNDFAHKIDYDSFEVQSIRDRCKNFVIVDRHVGPIPSVERGNITSTGSADPYIGLPNFREKLADPRFRYTMTAQLLSFQLGLGAANPNRVLPLI